MKKTKTKRFNFLLSIVALLLICCVAFVGCSNDADTSGSFTPQQPPQQNQMDYLGGGGTGVVPTEVSYSTNENSVVDASTIDLSSYKNDIADSLEGIETLTLNSDGSVEITSAGSYILTGEYSGGITISSNVAKDETIHLYLNNATISSATSSGVVKSDNKINLIITVLDGTTNSISTTAEGENALQVKGTLVINGSGTLSINGSSTDSSAIKVSKTCTIVDATVNLSSTKHGISAETIQCEDATIIVSSATKDGLHSECDFDNKKGNTYDFTLETGYVYLKNAKYTCTVNGDGIQADTFVYIEGGETNITTEGEFVQYSDSNKTTYDLEDDDFRYIKNGSSYQKVADDYKGSLSSRYALTQSSKGIKVGEIEYDTDGDDIDDAVVESDGYTIYLNGGTYVINSTDDAIHTNSGNTFIKDGNFTINTNDDAIMSDLLTEIDGGTINIQSSYEGIEGAYVKITNGTITIFSSDDGINSASDDTSITEYIIITGGTITVDANGDGLDSNGSILISGGTITVCGPTSNADGALDAENGIIVNGGTLVAYSSLGMVETPSQNSSQYVVSYGQTSNIASNSTVIIKDSNGNEVVSFTTTKISGSIIVSCPEFKNGETYTLYIGSNLISTFTISNQITTLGASNNFSGGGMGGNMGGGGMPPQQNGTSPAKPTNKM